MAELVDLTSQDLNEIRTNQGKSLLEISRSKPVLLVFLRHLGCTFCREALRDISDYCEKWGEDAQEIVLVHMEDAAVAEPFFSKYGLEGCQHITDKSQVLYRRFGLAKGSFSQLFGFKTMVRGFKAGVSMDQFGGGTFGDAFQMPGIFVIHKGEVVTQYIHKTISDRPDYRKLLNCCVT
ncbi:MAG: redoxin domain-containing protein [Saprospiraceae bacterium]|nr:redoxin domain-containing protein [Saprospiraceae bacterium]